MDSTNKMLKQLNKVNKRQTIEAEMVDELGDDVPELTFSHQNTPEMENQLKNFLTLDTPPTNENK